MTIITPKKQHFFTWAQVYASNEPTIIKPTDEHVEFLIPQLMPPATDQNRAWAIHLNPGMGMFGVSDDGGDRKLVLLHHFFRKTTIGLPPSDNDPTLFCFHDVLRQDEMVEIPASFMDSSEEDKLLVPTWDELMKIEAVADLENFQDLASLETEEIYSLMLMPIPPKFIKLMHSYRDTWAGMLVAGRNYILELQGEPDSDGTVEALVPILQYIWAHATGLDDMKYIDRDQVQLTQDVSVAQAGQDCILRFFQAPSPGGEAANQLAMLSMSRGDSSPLRITLDDDDNKGNKKNWKNNILPNLKRLILHASMTFSTDEVDDKPCANLLALINSQKEQAREMLKSYLRSKDLDLEIDEVTAKQIRNGYLLDEGHSLKESFNIFICMEPDSDNVRGKSYKAKLGIAKTRDELVNQIKNYKGMCEFMFGDKSALVVFLIAWLSMLEKAKGLSRAAIRNDPTWLVKVLSSIHNRSVQFLASCEQAATPEKIDFEILNPRTEFDCIRCSQMLAATIPSEVQDMMEKKTPKRGQEKLDEADPNPSSPKKGKVAINVKKNLANIKNFKANYKVLKHHLSTMPKVNEVAMCARFHGDGKCLSGSKCPFAESHIQLTKEQDSAFATWIDTTCKENKDEKAKKNNKED